MDLELNFNLFFASKTLLWWQSYTIESEKSHETIIVDYFNFVGP